MEGGEGVEINHVSLPDTAVCKRLNGVQRIAGDKREIYFNLPESCFATLSRLPTSLHNVLRGWKP